MYPTGPRFVALGANATRFMGSQPQPGKGKIMFGIGAFIGMTVLSYWWGYDDIDKRHRGTLWLNKQEISEDQVEASQAM